MHGEYAPVAVKNQPVHAQRLGNKFDASDMQKSA